MTAEVDPRSSEPGGEAGHGGATGFELAVQSRFTNNCLFLVDALGDNDFNTASRLDEDVAALALNAGMGKRYVHYRKARNKEEFFDALAELHEWCELGHRPILHIEGHGDTSSGLQVASSQEVVDWAALDVIFREINSAAGGHMGVVLSTCFGFKQLQLVAIDRPSPYVFMIGPKDVIKAGNIESDLMGFYAALLGGKDLSKAVATLPPTWGYLDSQHVFALAFAKHLEAGRSSRETSRLADEMISKLAGRDEFLDSIPFSTKRKGIKGLLRKMRLDMELYSRIFFHGRPPPVTHAQISAFVRDYKMGL